MSDYKSDLVRTLVDRGYLYQATDLDALDGRAATAPITGYIGFDMTASSLHVGSLVQIMMLRRMQQAGHTPIVLLGGATTKVGDPSGKDAARPVLTPEMIAGHVEGILKPFKRLLDLDRAVIVNNDDWLAGYGYLDFLRDYGRHFTINRMLSFDSVRLRLDREQPLTFLEFNYMLLQAVDFLELNRRLNCTLQLGGADQWGNIINGVELCRRVDGAEVFGFTTPLITTASGAKMGKTAEGAVWLNEDMLSAYDYWQFWRNTEDADVSRFLKLFTDLPLDEISRLDALQGSEINAAKVTLANAATALLHGGEAARQAEQTARETFAAGGAGAGLPTLDIDPAALDAGELVLTGLLADIGLVASRGEAKRKMKEGAVRLNDEPIRDPNAALSRHHLQDGAAKLSVGKKKHALARLA